MLIGFEAGLVIAAASVGVFTHAGEMDDQAVVASHRAWWAYWKEYWRRKDGPDPMPVEYACKVTITAGPDT